MIHVSVSVLEDFTGGAPGCIHIDTFAFHVPIIPARALWPSLGVMYLVHASIIAFCSGVICGCFGASAANALVHTTSTTRANQTLIFIRFSSSLFSRGRFGGEFTSEADGPHAFYSP